MRFLPKFGRVIYQEIYKLHKARIKADRLPVLPHLAAGFTVQDAYLLKAGKREVDGVAREFQDIRVYLQEG